MPLEQRSVNAQQSRSNGFLHLCMQPVPPSTFHTSSPVSLTPPPPLPPPHPGPLSSQNTTPQTPPQERALVIKAQNDFISQVASAAPGSIAALLGMQGAGGDYSNRHDGGYALETAANKGVTALFARALPSAPVGGVDPASLFRWSPGAVGKVVGRGRAAAGQVQAVTGGYSAAGDDSAVDDSVVDDSAVREARGRRSLRREGTMGTVSEGEGAEGVGGRGDEGVRGAESGKGGSMAHSRRKVSL